MKREEKRRSRDLAIQSVKLFVAEVPQGVELPADFSQAVKALFAGFLLVKDMGD